MDRVHEFAERLGSLKPKRTGAGYRVYADRDLERLEQIVAISACNQAACFKLNLW
jgi:DNA-binding transcriptional MerR regulator